MAQSIELFKLGDTFRASLVATPERMAAFRDLSGDANRVHHDAAYAQAHGFRGPIVFGNLTGLLVSQLVGMKLPTEEVIILRQTVDYRNPAYIGEEVRLEAVVASVHEAVQSVQLKLTFTSSSDALVATGTCVIKCL